MLMKNRGFTLIELMITLVVLTILLSWAVPSFRTAIQNNRITAQSNSFLSALSTARSEAVKRGVRVSVCASADMATCSGAATWETGWIVFSDNTGVTGDLDGTDTLIKVAEALDGTSTLRETGGATSASFDQLGRSLATATFQLRIPDCVGNQARDINIALTGRAAVSRTACP